MNAKMPRVPHRTIIGEPDGWTPSSEADHFIECPVCKERLDMRDLGQALDHWHEGPTSMSIDGKVLFRINRGRTSN